MSCFHLPDGWSVLRQHQPSGFLSIYRMWLFVNPEISVAIQLQHTAYLGVSRASDEMIAFHTRLYRGQRGSLGAGSRTWTNGGRDNLGSAFGEAGYASGAALRSKPPARACPHILPRSLDPKN